MPTTTASTSARQWCESRRESSPEIHLESPVRVATLPSSVIADLKRTNGRPVRACLRNGWLSSRARVASSPSATSTADALVAQDPEPAAGGLLGRVVGGDHDAREAGLEDRLRAGRRAAGVAARLQRDVQRRAAQVGAAGGRDRRALGVRLAQRGVEALAQHAAVAHDHRADERVGAGPPATALGELDRAGEVFGVGGLECAHVPTDDIDSEINPPTTPVRRR